MSKPILNLNITSKEELDRIINQYENGGKALLFLYDYEMIMRDAGKHGTEEYLKNIKSIIEENRKYYIDINDRNLKIDDRVLDIVAFACLEYFRSKYYETKNENGVSDSY